MADVNDEYFMSLALSQARHAWDLGEIPVGAVIVNAAKEIVSVGCNRTIIDNDPCAHAEIVALRNAGTILDTYRLTDLTMYVTLEPCCMCSGALIHARLKRLVYGAKDPKTGACGSVFDILIDSRHNHKIDVEGGVLESSCSDLLKSFFKMRRSMQKEGRDWILERGMTRFWQKNR